MARRRILKFGADAGAPFRLEILERLGGKERTHILTRGDDLVPGITPRALELLAILMTNAKTSVSRDDLLNLLPGANTHGLIDKYVSMLRRVLEGGADGELRRLGKSSYKGEGSLFIETMSHRYRFKQNVVVEEDRELMEAFPKWNPDRVSALLGHVKRDTASAAEDLRIVTTGLSPTLEALDIQGLLDRRLRIKILFMNAWNKSLIDWRYALRQDKPPARCVKELKDQIHDIRPLALKNKPQPLSVQKTQTPKTQKGSLEFGLSDLAPCGMVIHTSSWAIFGTFLLHDSYTHGPMMEIRKEDDAWEQLHKDWKLRWRQAMGQGMTTVKGVMPVKPWEDEKSVRAQPSRVGQPASV